MNSKVPMIDYSFVHTSAYKTSIATIIVVVSYGLSMTFSHHYFTRNRCSWLMTTSFQKLNPFKFITGLLLQLLRVFGNSGEFHG